MATHTQTQQRGTDMFTVVQKGSRAADIPYMGCLEYIWSSTTNPNSDRWGAEAVSNTTSNTPRSVEHHGGCHILVHLVADKPARKSKHEVLEGNTRESGLHDPDLGRVVYLKQVVESEAYPFRPMPKT